MADLVSAEEAGRILRPHDPLSAAAVRQRFSRAGIRARHGYLLDDVLSCLASSNKTDGESGDTDAQ